MCSLCDDSEAMRELKQRVLDAIESGALDLTYRPEVHEAAEARFEEQRRRAAALYRQELLEYGPVSP
jgi:hypothetical protein